MSLAKILLTGVVLLASGASFALFLGTDKEHARATPSLAPPTPREETLVVQGIGYIEPVSDVRNLSFKGGGVIADCKAEIGKRVRAGDVLMALDDAAERRTLAVAEKELDLARADRDDVLAGVNKFEITAAAETLEVAKHRMRLTEQEFHRNDEMVKKRVTTQSDRDNCVSAYQQASAEVRRAEANLLRLQHFVTPEHKQVMENKVLLASARKDQAARTVADMRLLAPMDGTVLEILRREGESVSVFLHEPVIVFGDPARLRVRAEIDERYVRAVKPGQRVTVYGRALNRQTYRGKVALVKDLMGKRTIFTRSSTERKDLDVVQVFIAMGADFVAPAGLRVDVAITIDPKAASYESASPPDAAKP
jgi:HlyD family secretion protein